jgi:hypothetical protein
LPARDFRHQDAHASVRHDRSDRVGGALVSALIGGSAAASTSPVATARDAALLVGPGAESLLCGPIADGGDRLDLEMARRCLFEVYAVASSTLRPIQLPQRLVDQIADRS